ncbi:hypothetical protein IAT38_005843 [Cryptococcus sp. DSM 104549]
MSTSPQPLFTTSPLFHRPSQPHPVFASPPTKHTSSSASYRSPSSSRSLTPSSPSLSYNPHGPAETLSFAKIPLPTSTTASTDSEAGALSSDFWGYPDPSSPTASRSGAQSPSLITTLFQTQKSNGSSSAGRSRQTSACSTGSTYPTPITPVTSGNGGCAGKPILRRDTFSTSGEEAFFPDGYGLGITRGSAQQQAAAGAGAGVTSTGATGVKKRPSVLTFAVNPCLPSPRSRADSSAAASASVSARSRSRSRSSTSSLMSSQSQLPTHPHTHRPSPPPRTSSWGSSRSPGGSDEYDSEDDDEDEEDQENGNSFMESPIPIPGHESDSDEGYHEDEEDGFTSDEEDVLPRGAGGCVGLDTFALGPNGSAVRRHPLSWGDSQWTVVGVSHPSSAAAATPKRRTRTIAYEDEDEDNAYPYPPSTTDDGAARPFPPTRKNSSIHILADKPSNPRCTRHRSPPPPIRTKNLTLVEAPPAARSPSAAELCRRRGSASASATVGMGRTARGWKSDDPSLFLGGGRKVPQSATAVEAPRAKLAIPPPVCEAPQRGRDVRPGVGGRKASLPVGVTMTGGILRRGSDMGSDSPSVGTGVGSAAACRTNGFAVPGQKEPATAGVTPSVGWKDIQWGGVGMNRGEGRSRSLDLESGFVGVGGMEMEMGDGLDERLEEGVEMLRV